MSVSYTVYNEPYDYTVNNEPYDYKREVKGGSFGAYMAASGVVAIPQVASGRILTAMQKAHRLPENDLNEIRNAAQKIIKKQGLADMGVEIKYLKKRTTAPKTIWEAINPLEQASAGRNAFFTNRNLTAKNSKGEKIILCKKNTVLMPEKELQGCVFHELGHAHTWNKTKLLKLCQTPAVRLGRIIIPAVLLLYGALTKKSKPKDGNTELTGGQKANNFIRNNAGKLAFLAMVPTLIEEAAATIKGNKFAKEFVSKNIANKTFKANWIGFSTYLLTAIFGGLGAYTAVKIKDRAIEKKEKELKAICEAADWRFGADN